MNLKEDSNYRERQIERVKLVLSLITNFRLLKTPVFDIFGPAELI